MNTEELLKLLVCPVCKNKLEYLESDSKSGFACGHCQTVYPIRDDIPIMLVEEAIAINDWQKDN